MTLTAARLREVLDYDLETGHFTWLKRLAPRGPAGSRAGCNGTLDRIDIRIDGKLYQAHRLAWLHVTGEWPPALIDHVNGNRSDNRWANLRPADSLQNAHNTCAHRDGASGIKGVRYEMSRKKWSARLFANGEFRLLKRFDTKEEAIAAYREAAKKHHGEFARIA